MNEELRSATEQLETCREELQCLNEELRTLKRELEVKSEELSHTIDDMRNLVSSNEIGTVFLDRRLRVKLFTPRAQDVFNFIQADIGRPIHDITHKLTGDVNLTADIERVVEQLHTIERDVQTRDGRCHIMRVLPYLTVDDRIDGVMLIFLEITERMKAEADLVESHARAEEHGASRARAEALLSHKADLLRRIVEAQEEERRRLARELHDEMGQHLTALKIGIESITTDDGNETSTRLRQILADLNRSIDRLAFELRPAALTDVGLDAAIGQLVDYFQLNTGISIDLHIRGMEGARLPGFIETTLYRATQEALTNVAKHANATNVSVMLERRADQAQVIIEDDGRGFDPEEVLRPDQSNTQLGLLGMKERTELTGGSFHIESRAGATSIYVRIPVPKREDPE